MTFRFNVRDYSKFTKKHTGQRLEFDDFDIDCVAVSGEFNHRSREGWKMEKVGKCIYELQKSITDFNDAFAWEFKFVVNNAY